VGTYKCTDVPGWSAMGVWELYLFDSIRSRYGYIFRAQFRNADSSVRSIIVGIRRKHDQQRSCIGTFAITRRMIRSGHTESLFCCSWCCRI